MRVGGFYAMPESSLGGDLGSVGHLIETEPICAWEKCSVVKDASRAVTRGDFGFELKKQRFLLFEVAQAREEA